MDQERRKAIGMAQPDDGIAESGRLPSVEPMQARPSNSSVEAANEFFASLDVTAIAEPEGSGRQPRQNVVTAEIILPPEAIVERSAAKSKPRSKSSSKPRSKSKSKLKSESPLIEPPQLSTLPESSKRSSKWRMEPAEESDDPAAVAASSQSATPADRKPVDKRPADKEPADKEPVVSPARSAAVPLAKKVANGIRGRSSRRRTRPRPAVPVIEIETREDEPFHWKQIFTTRWLKQNSGFVFSFVLHLFVLLLLSFLIVRSGIGDSRIFLDIAEGPASADDEMMEMDLGEVAFEAEFDLENEELNEQFEDQLNEETAELDGLELSELSELMESSDSAVLSGSLANDGVGDGKSAMFFGTKASGRRFIFVVDRSVSMEYGSHNFPSAEAFNRYDVAKSELLQAIKSLQPHQEFFVFLFAGDTLAMFDADLGAEHALIAATAQNKQRFRDWLDRVPLGDGTDPREGLKIAMRMKPDAIFMLSDGEFVSERNDRRPKTREIVDSQTSRGTAVPINTVSLEVESTKAAMKYIADRTSGKFRFLRIADYVQQLLTVGGPLQERALRQVLKMEVDGWPNRKALLQKNLLPMLSNRSLASRARAETLLQDVTFGLFAGKAPSILEEPQEAQKFWADVIRETDGFHRTGQITSLGRERELAEKLLLALSELKDDSVFELLEQLDVSRLRTAAVVSLVQRIDHYHDLFDATPKSIGWLRYLSARLDGKTPRPRAELEKSLWSTEQAKASMDSLFESRQKRAAGIYEKYQDKRRARNVRERLGRSLISKYPETDEAQRAREELSDISDNAVVEQEGELVGNPFGDEEVD